MEQNNKIIGILGGLGGESTGKLYLDIIGHSVINKHN